MKARPEVSAPQPAARIADESPGSTAEVRWARTLGPLGPERRASRPERPIGKLCPDARATRGCNRHAARGGRQLRTKAIRSLIRIAMLCTRPDPAALPGSLSVSLGGARRRLAVTCVPAAHGRRAMVRPRGFEPLAFGFVVPQKAQPTTTPPHKSAPYQAVAPGGFWLLSGLIRTRCRTNPAQRIRRTRLRPLSTGPIAEG